MVHRHHRLRGFIAALMIVASAGYAAAQTGRIGGVVKDETGQAIKGATVTAENPARRRAAFTATTDDKGRFSIIGLRDRYWTFTAQAPGFGPEKGTMRVQTIGQAESAAHLHTQEGRPSGADERAGQRRRRRI